jgi:hypothetical protein
MLPLIDTIGGNVAGQCNTLCIHENKQSLFRALGGTKPGSLANQFFDPV